MQKPSLLQISFGVSILFHAIVFGVLGVMGFNLNKPAFQQEENLATLTLVAAPDEPAVPTPMANVVIPVRSLPPKKPVEKLVPVEEPLKQPITLEPPPVTSVLQLSQTAVVTKPVPQMEFHGDASSAKPSVDAVTVQARPNVEAKPNYLKNPEPIYPESARRRHQEGLVLLVVKVTAQGHAGSVEIKKSSGFSALDDAAMEAVRDWEFEPARIGALAFESEIVVPVHFKLSPTIEQRDHHFIQCVRPVARLMAKYRQPSAKYRQRPSG